MKILTRKEFLKTPRNTLWSYYEPCCFRELNIKTTDGNDNENDFVYFSLIAEFDTQNSEFSEICQRMEMGESFPQSFEETSREGLFDDEQLFLVYEKEDIENMVKTLSELLQTPSNEELTGNK
jgi:hypothetical protein